MQTTPLLISSILRHGTTLHGASEVVTWTADGPRRSTYAEVGQDCRRLANALRRLGVDGDQRVATFMWNNTEHLELYLTVPAMGAVLHALNIRLFPEQLVYVATHANDTVVVVDNSLAAPFSKLLAHLKTIGHVVVNGPVPDDVREALTADGRCSVHDYRELLDAEEPDFAWPELDENTGAAMCYTSGTTGNPKGVVYSHRSNVLHSMQLAMTSALGLEQGDRVLAVVPLFHANAWGLPYACLMTGASVVMPDRFLQAEPLARMLAEERVTAGAAVPTIWTDLLRLLDERAEAGDPVDLSRVRGVLIGGSACPPSLMRGYAERHGVNVLHAWGMTEMSPLGTVAVPPAGLGEEETWRYKESQGRLSPLVEARLVGPAGEEIRWDGKSVGELEVRGPWIASSYYTAPGEEPAADMLDKFDAGWLRTGDVGSLTPDGFLRLTDRSKDVIKSGGEWISSVELENALMAHPAVAEASVVGVPDDRWGERPLATVVLAEGKQADAGELRDFLSGKVADWQLPERWAFVEEVPKTSVGKFDKKRIRAHYAEGDLDVTTVG